MAAPTCAWCHGPIGLGEREVSDRAIGCFLTVDQMLALSRALGLDTWELHPTCIGHVMAEAV